VHIAGRDEAETKVLREVAEGEAENPNITITVTSSDWMDIVSGKLNGQMAFLTGKLKIQGDMSLAMKLQNLTG